MTAHVVFSDIDPVAPATTSATMVEEVIRGFIGFQGLLMSDDIAMGALSGSVSERARASLAAGCDIVLHCNGKLDEMRAVAAECGPLQGLAKERAEAALAARQEPEEFDVDEGRKTFAALVAGEWRVHSRRGHRKTVRKATRQSPRLAHVRRRRRS
jgi:beta-N-acetylhexosaminidase